MRIASSPPRPARSLVRRPNTTARVPSRSIAWSEAPRLATEIQRAAARDVSRNRLWLAGCNAGGFWVADESRYGQGSRNAAALGGRGRFLLSARPGVGRRNSKILAE